MVALLYSKVQGVHKCLFCVGIPKETEDTDVCLPHIGRDVFPFALECGMETYPAVDFLFIEKLWWATPLAM